MRGSPILRAFAVVIVLLLAAIPVWNLTHQVRAANNSALEPLVSLSQFRVTLTFAHQPDDFQVLYLGKVIWQSPPQPAAEEQKDFNLEFPKEGIDLEIKADWPPGTPNTAVRVNVHHGFGSTEQTAWGKDNVDAVLTFKDPQ